MFVQIFGPQSLDKQKANQHIARRAPEQADAEFGMRGPHTDMWGFGACVLHLALPWPHSTAAGISHAQEETP